MTRSPVLCRTELPLARLRVAMETLIAHGAAGGCTMAARQLKQGAETEGR